MIELPDDELDKLFRKSSEELDPDYEPKDWNALSKRLDREDGKTPAGWFRKWWMVGMLALLIPAGLGVYYLLNHSDSNKGNTKSASSNSTHSKSITPVESPNVESVSKSKDSFVKSGEVAENKIAENNTEETKNSKENNEKKTPESSKIIAKTADIGKTQYSKVLPRSQSKTGGVYLEPNRSRRKVGEGAFYSFKNKAENSQKSTSQNRVPENLNKEIVPGKRNSDRDLNGNISIGQTDKTNASSTENNRLIIARPDSAEEENRLLLSANTLSHLPFSGIKPLQFPAIELSKTTQTAELPEQEKPQEPYPKMAFRFGYSPDLSSVGVKNFSKPGSAVSLMIEYALIRKLYLQIGVVRSEKVYNAKANEYELYPYVTQINTPDNIDGTCNMFEIPLGVRYDLAQNKHSRWFAGTGFTSYYINKEKYVYNYKKYIHGQKAGWEGKTGWYWLSHINVSAGYEYRVSKKLSLLAEPYVKIPIKKVGYGKVDLFTAGMWLSIRYTPVFK